MKLGVRTYHRDPTVHNGMPVWLLFSCTGLLLLSGLGRAQNQSASFEPEDTNGVTPIRVNSDLVLIPVTVLDHEGRPFIGLQRENFTLFDDGKEQPITHFALEDVPISVGFVVDASSSMAGKMQKSREAVRTFLSTANSGDEFFLVRFSELVELAVGLTKDPEELQRRLRFVPAGRTALLDAISFSINQMKKANNTRKSLIIVSDGGDNFSRSTRSELRSLVLEADLQIYAMGIFDPVEVRARTHEEADGPGLLQEITMQSGGRLFQIENVDRLPEFAWKLGSALRAQYVLGYSPNRLRRDGKYHRVVVKIVQVKEPSNLQTSWRRGYYSPAE